MIKKIIGSLLGITLLVILSLILSFIIVFNKRSIDNVLIKIKYYDKTEQNISTLMQSYIDLEFYKEVVTKEQIKSDINRSLENFYQGKKIDKKVIKDRMQEFLNLEISYNLEKKGLEVNSESISDISNNLSEIYVSNLFLLDEMNLLAPYIKNIKILPIVLIIVLVLINLIIYLFRKKNILIIFSTSFMLLLTLFLMIKFSSFYYLNNIVSDFIQTLWFHYKTYNIVIGIIYLMIYFIMKKRFSNS